MSRLYLASLAAVITLSLAGMPTPVQAQVPPPTEKPAPDKAAVQTDEDKIQIEAMKLYSRIIQHYQAMNALSADVEMDLHQGEETINVTFALRMKTPNKAALKALAKVRGISYEKIIISNGKDVFQYDGVEKTYTRTLAPKDFQEFFDKQDLPVFGLRMVFLPEQAAKDMAVGIEDESLTPAAKRAAIGVHLSQLRLGPEETRDGVTLLPLIIQPRDMAASELLLTLYVGKDDNLIHQAKAGDTTMSLSEVYKNVKVNPTLPASTFVFTPPKEAKPAPVQEKQKEGKP